MTQSIDRPRHRQGETNGALGMPFTPPGGHRRPTASDHVPSFPQYGTQYGSQFSGAQYQRQFPQQFPQQPEPPRSNGLATAGLVVAIIAAILSFVPIVGMVAWVLAPVGLVLSAVGLARSGKARSGRGTSIAGVLLSIVALIICIVYLVGITSAVASGVNAANQQSTAVHAVTYKVTTAKKSKVSVSYSQSQNDNLATGSAIGVSAPWTQNAQVSGFAGPNVTASISPELKHMNKSDTVTCTIIEDGVQVAQNSATGPNASVSCMK